MDFKYRQTMRRHTFGPTSEFEINLLFGMTVPVLFGLLTNVGSYFDNGFGPFNYPPE